MTVADDTRALVDSPEARFEFLREWDVLAEHEDGTVTTTEPFEYERGLFLDTYGDVDDETFERVVAETFDLSGAEAAARIEELDVTREEVCTYLALRSYLSEAGDGSEDERPPSIGTSPLALLAGMVADVAPATPVPDSMTELTDEDYCAFVDDRGDAVVFVWKRECEPCDAMKAELEEVLSALPDGVAVAGVDGESVPSFCRSFEVEAAPTTLVFADGDLALSLRGRRRPDRLAEAFADAYGADA